MQETLEGSSVSPPSFQFIPSHLVALDVGVIYVRDFHLIAPGRLERANDVKDFRVVHVDAYDGVIGFGFSRFLFDAQDAIAFKLRHAEALRVWNFLENNFRAAPLMPKLAHGLADVAF